MKILEIKGSSSISKISFNYEQNLVGISFTYNPNKEYLYLCDDLNAIETKLETVSSIGKLINECRKDGTFKNIEV